MNAHNPTEIQSRVSYYGVSGVPNTTLDGGSPGAPNTVVTNTTINNRYAVPSPFSIALSFTKTGGVVNVEAVVTAAQAVSESNLKLHLVVMEQTIEFETAPGSNGEKVFKNVAKKWLPNASGQDLPASWASGTSNTYTGSWTMANVYDENQIVVAAFIQNQSTRAVHQAGFAGPVASFDLDASIKAVMNVPSVVCLGGVDPTVQLINYGNNNLTSAEISYSVNGGTPMIFNWTGNLSFLQSENITLPNIGFGAAASYTLTATVGKPNGAASDENADNNAKSFDFVQGAATNTATATVTIKPDSYGSEITWELRNENTGALVASGGPYADNDVTEKVTNHDLATDGCYRFNIYDSYGDGLNANYPAPYVKGFYKVEGDGAILVQGGSLNNTNYTDMASSAFRKGTGVSSVDLKSYLNEVVVFPNPTNGNAAVTFNLVKDTQVSIALFNASGVKVADIASESLLAGKHTFGFATGALAQGLYFVNISTQDGNMVEKIMVTK
jgi:hypothetical protein